LSAPLELVRVTQAHAGVSSRRRHPPAPGLAGGRGRTVGGRGNTLEGPAAAGHKLAGPSPRPLLPPLEVEVVVEGLQQPGGVWRSTATCLTLPLQQPLRVRTTAHQLPDGRVLLTAGLACCLALPALLTALHLEP
ncbi:hypothetical protein Agub_g8115, partial [Astrephomene gubernaculifera]